MYEFVLKQGFLPSHANEFLKQLQKDGKIVTYEGSKPARKGSFYINYTNACKPDGKKIIIGPNPTPTLF